MLSGTDSHPDQPASAVSFTDDNPDFPTDHQDSLSATPYDDAFRTMTQYCSELLIPVINEIFGTQYSGDEIINFHSNEHMLNASVDSQKKRITDSVFSIVGQQFFDHYILECQSNADNTIILRIFEYCISEALNTYTLNDNELTVTFPKASVLYLRSSKETPSLLTIQMKATRGTAFIDAPVMKLSDYSMDDLFNKKLYFLLPFYLFNLEKEIKISCRETKDLHGSSVLQSTLIDLISRVEKLIQTGELNYYQRTVIFQMLYHVSEALFNNYFYIKQEVDHLMRGKVIEIEAINIYNKGREEGRQENQLTSIKELMAHTKWPVEQVMDALGIDPAKREKLISLL